MEEIQNDPRLSRKEIDGRCQESSRSAKGREETGSQRNAAGGEFYSRRAVAGRESSRDHPAGVRRQSAWMAGSMSQVVEGDASAAWRSTSLEDSSGMSANSSRD